MTQLRQSRAVSPHSLLVVLLVTAIAAVTGCTRDPFDAERPEQRFENKYTYTTILPNEDISYVAAAVAADGRMAVAAFTGLRELTILESTAGAWSEIKTLSGNGIIARVVDLAAGADGSWWVAASNTDTGAKLYRIGGPGDAVYTPPDSANVPWDALDERIAVQWDSTEALVAVQPDGWPILALRSPGRGLVHAALADTGWALSLIQNSTDTGFLWDMAVDENGVIHTIFQPSSTATGHYSRVGSDSTHSSEIPGSGAFLALALDADNLPFVAGGASGISRLRLWHWRPDTPVTTWPSEELPLDTSEPYLANCGIVIETDETPHFYFALFHGSQRFDLMWGTRSPETAGFGWSLDPIVRDIPHMGDATRLRGFKVLLDTFDRPNFIFLTAPIDRLNADLVVAVPRDL